MKLTILPLLLLLAIAAAACGKASDLPHLREEAQGVVKNYAPRFEDLQRRAESLIARGNALGVNQQEAQVPLQVFGAAMARLQALRGRIAAAPAEIDAAAKKSHLEMQRVLDSLRDDLRKGATELMTDLDAVEGWIWLAEQQPRRPPPGQAVPGGTDGAAGLPPSAVSGAGSSPTR